jgi:hypothetical protein
MGQSAESNNILWVVKKQQKVLTQDIGQLHLLLTLSPSLAKLKLVLSEFSKAK